ncbi:MAG TPA: response regulator [Flavipsychrobacter sp.]
MKDRSVILVVDDDRDELLFLSEAFREIGHGNPVAYADGGMLMFDMLHETGANRYGLIVLDLNMPGIDGLETLRKLKQHAEYAHIPVVIYSTSGNEAEKNLCIQCGAVDFITKPDSRRGYITACTRFASLLGLANL